MSRKKKWRELVDVDTPCTEDQVSPPPDEFAGKTVREVERQIRDAEEPKR